MVDRDALINAAVSAMFHVAHGTACDCIVDGELDSDTLLQAVADAAEAGQGDTARIIGRWLLLDDDDRAEAFGHLCDQRGHGQ